jgi:hypothetical protein
MNILKIVALTFCGFAVIGLAQESAEPPAEAAVIEELSQEELDAEMARIEEALGDTGELKEFIPSKPLAADLPVSLPSDI